MPIQFMTPAPAQGAGTREELVLLEQTPDFYPEFMAFLKPQLKKNGGSLFFRGPSGQYYRLGEADHAGLKGIALYLKAEKNQTIERDKVDGDVWAFLEWLVEGAGGEWSTAALIKTGAIYKVPGAPPRV